MRSIFTPKLEKIHPHSPDGIYSSVRKDADAAAANTRQLLHFDIGEQTALKSSQRHYLPNILRRKFEASGVLTFRRTELQSLGVRGICIYADPLPVVIFGKESSAAQSFTLSHELGHVVLRESGISGPVRRKSSEVEKWCDQFAASFLMPLSAIREMRRTGS